MNKQKVSTKSSAIFLAIVLIAGTIALSSPSFMTGAEAYPYNNNYDNDHKFKYKPSFDKFGKSSSSSYNKCINANLNFPGLDFSPSFGAEAVDALGVESLARDGGNSGPNNGGHDDGFKKFDKDGFICINANDNSVRGGIDRGEEEPQTGSLTVNKEIYGCDNVFLDPDILILRMVCTSILNDSPDWILCDDPAISTTVFCQALTEDLFDIEVLDDQNNQIEQFEGSVQGTTIDNLESGTYTVNEIKAAEGDNQLVEEPAVKSDCNDQEFPDGGILSTTDPNVGYDICLEYEDEQGNDCSTITLAAGEEKICTVKNYIRQAAPF